MPDRIQLVVGLGNPGPDYAATRHNAGAWFVEMLANQHAVQLKFESKFSSKMARLQLENYDYWLMVPTTFMNHCGLAIKSVATFYKFPPENILVVHDELDFPPGVIRFKQSGGHGGHNGLRDIIHQLHSHDFHRLRIGIGHPGNRHQVADYVLNRPGKKEHELIIEALCLAQSVLPSFLSGNYQQAIAQLHNEN